MNVNKEPIQQDRICPTRECLEVALAPGPKSLGGDSDPEMNSMKFLWVSAMFRLC